MDTEDVEGMGYSGNKPLEEVCVCVLPVPPNFPILLPPRPFSFLVPLPPLLPLLPFLVPLSLPRAQVWSVKRRWLIC